MKVNFSLLPTEPRSQPEALAVFSSRSCGLLATSPPDSPMPQPPPSIPNTAPRYSNGPLHGTPLRAFHPGTHSWLKVSEFFPDHPSTLLPASLAFFQLNFTLIHSFNNLFNKHLLRARLVRMLWAKRYRKLTQNFLNNEENYYFL